MILKYIFVLVSFLLPSITHAAEWGGQLEYSPGEKTELIEGLSIDTFSPGIEFETIDDVPRSYAYIEGDFEKPGWKLYINRKLIANDKHQTFKKRVFANQKITAVEFIALSPEKKIIRLRMNLKFENYRNFEEAVAKRVTRDFFAFVSLGPTFFQMTELVPKNSDAADLKLNSIYPTVKFTLVKPMLKGFDFALSLYSAIPIGYYSVSGIKVIPLGANLRAGWVLPFVKDPWKISVLAGVGYSSVFLTASSAGYKHFVLPQVFPTIRYRSGGNSFINGYFKFAPLMDGANIKNLSERELGLGVGYVFYPLKWQRAISINIDYSNLYFEFAENHNFRANSYSASVGVGL